MKKRKLLSLLVSISMIFSLINISTIVSGAAPTQLDGNAIRLDLTELKGVATNSTVDPGNTPTTAKFTLTSSGFSGASVFIEFDISGGFDLTAYERFEIDIASASTSGDSQYKNVNVAYGPDTDISNTANWYNRGGSESKAFTGNPIKGLGDVETLTVDINQGYTYLTTTNRILINVGCNGGADTTFEITRIEFFPLPATYLVIDTQPAAFSNLEVSDSANLTIAASGLGTSPETPEYQWFVNTVKAANTTPGGTVTALGTSTPQAINTTSAGTYYYYCEVKGDSDIATRVVSNISTVIVRAPGANEANCVIIDFDKLVPSAVYNNSSTGNIRTVGNGSPSATVSAGKALELTVDDWNSGIVFRVDLGDNILADYNALEFDGARGPAGGSLLAYATKNAPVTSGFGDNGSVDANKGLLGSVTATDSVAPLSVSLAGGLGSGVDLGTVKALTGEIFISIGVNSNSYTMDIGSFRLKSATCLSDDCVVCDPCVTCTPLYNNNCDTDDECSRCGLVIPAANNHACGESGCANELCDVDDTIYFCLICDPITSLDIIGFSIGGDEFGVGTIYNDPNEWQVLDVLYGTDFETDLIMFVPFDADDVGYVKWTDDGDTWTDVDFQGGDTAVLGTADGTELIIAKVPTIEITDNDWDDEITVTETGGAARVLEAADGAVVSFYTHELEIAATAGYDFDVVGLTETATAGTYEVDGDVNAVITVTDPAAGAAEALALIDGATVESVEIDVDLDDPTAEDEAVAALIAAAEALVDDTDYVITFDVTDYDDNGTLEGKFDVEHSVYDFNKATDETDRNITVTKAGDVAAGAKIELGKLSGGAGLEAAYEVDFLLDEDYNTIVKAKLENFMKLKAEAKINTTDYNVTFAATSFNASTGELIGKFTITHKVTGANTTTGNDRAFTMTVMGGGSAVVTKLTVSDPLVHIEPSGGSRTKTITVSGLSLTGETVTVGAFLAGNDTNVPDIIAEATGSGATTRSAVLAFPENTSATAKVYTIKATLDSVEDEPFVVEMGAPDEDGSWTHANIGSHQKIWEISDTGSATMAEFKAATKLIFTVSEAAAKAANSNGNDGMGGIAINLSPIAFDGNSKHAHVEANHTTLYGDWFGGYAAASGTKGASGAEISWSRTAPSGGIMTYTLNIAEAKAYAEFIGLSEGKILLQYNHNASATTSIFTGMKLEGVIEADPTWVTGTETATVTVKGTSGGHVCDSPHGPCADPECDTPECTVYKCMICDPITSMEIKYIEIGGVSVNITKDEGGWWNLNKLYDVEEEDWYEIPVALNAADGFVKWSANADGSYPQSVNFGGEDKVVIGNENGTHLVVYKSPTIQVTNNSYADKLTVTCDDKEDRELFASNGAVAIGLGAEFTILADAGYDFDYTGLTDEGLDVFKVTGNATITGKLGQIDIPDGGITSLEIKKVKIDGEEVKITTDDGGWWALDALYEVKDGTTYELPVGLNAPNGYVSYSTDGSSFIAVEFPEEPDEDGNYPVKLGTGDDFLVVYKTATIKILGENADKLTVNRVAPSARALTAVDGAVIVSNKGTFSIVAAENFDFDVDGLTQVGDTNVYKVDGGKNATITAKTAGGPDTNLDVTAAKGLIDGKTTWTSTQATAGGANNTKAIAEVEKQVKALSGFSALGVTIEVVPGTYTAPVAGTSSNKSGTNGSFAFTVKINKSGATEQISASKTLVITATAHSTSSTSPGPGGGNTGPGGGDTTANTATAAVTAQAAAITTAANAGNGGTVKVTMGTGNTSVSKEVLTSIVGKDVNLVLDFGTYQVTLNGKDITTAMATADTNIVIQKTADEKGSIANFVIPQTNIDTQAKALPVQKLKIGTGASKALVGEATVNVGAANAGQNAILASFNASTGKFEFVSGGTIAANGTAKLGFKATGDYVVIVRQTGDITGTGKVETTDALELLKAIVGTVKLDPMQEFVANSKQTEISTADALNILKFVVGSINKL